MLIHENAIIGKDAVIGENNDIGPHVVIRGNVTIGNNNKIGPSTVITGNIRIGNNNTIYGHVYIGGLPQDLTYTDCESYIVIGNHNIIREFATVHRGTKKGSTTYIGDNNYIMVATHIAHNCRVGNNIIMVNGAALAGYAEVFDHAFLGGFAIVHQFCRIGSYSICGVLTKVTKDIPPFMMIDGNPASVRGLNLVGLKRKGFGAERREIIKRAYKILYRSGYSVPHALEELKKLEPQSADIQLLVEFIENSKRGVLLKSPRNSSAVNEGD